MAERDVSGARDVGLLAVRHDRPLIDSLWNKMVGVFGEISI